MCILPTPKFEIISARISGSVRRLSTRARHCFPKDMQCFAALLIRCPERRAQRESGLYQFVFEDREKLAVFERANIGHGREQEQHKIRIFLESGGNRERKIKQFLTNN